MPELSQSTIQSAVSKFNKFLSESNYKNARLENHLEAAVSSDNFIVYARDGRTASEILNKAEELRKTLSKEYFGHEKPSWKDPLVIGVLINENKPPGGETKFDKLYDSAPEFKGCIVSGSKERILDSSLPHELSHALFATHFKGIVPRWADEGLSTLAESKQETDKFDTILINSLLEHRGIPMNDLFKAKEYPANEKDMLAFYGQGYSVTKFLVNIGENIEERENDGRKLSGKQRFIEFLEKGMDTYDWSEAANEFYGFKDLVELQEAWNKSLNDSVQKKTYIGNMSFGEGEIPQAMKERLSKTQNVLKTPQEITIQPAVIDPQSILRITEIELEKLVLPPR